MRSFTLVIRFIFCQSFHSIYYKASNKIGGFVLNFKFYGKIVFFCEHRGRKTKSTRARYSHSSILGIVWRILGWTPFGLLKFFLSLILVLQWQRINFQLGVEMSPLSILRNPRWRPIAIADGGHLGFLKTLNGDISTPSWKLILGPCTSRIKQEKNFIRPKGVQRKKAPSLPD